MRFQFGKYKGQEINSAPTDYLEWLIEAYGAFVPEIQRELETRALAAEANLSWDERIVEAGYKTLVKQVHPDAGGNTLAMQELNASATRMRRLIKIAKESAAGAAVGR